MPLRNVESIVKRSHISISNVLPVSAYNTLTTKTIVKNIFARKTNAIFFPNKRLRLPIFNSYLFNRIRIVPIFVHASSKPISLIIRRIEYLTKALFAQFSKINVF